MIAAVLLCVLGLFFNDATASALAAAGLAGHIGGMLLMTWMVERPIRKMLRARGESPSPFSVAAVARLIAAVPLTYVLYMIAVLVTAWTRCVEWRGIRYEINGPFDVRMLHYEPFRRAEEPISVDVSL